LRNSPVRGKSGPIQVSRNISIIEEYQSVLPFYQAAMNFGIPWNPDLNGVSRFGLGLGDVNGAGGERSTSTKLLGQVWNSTNLSVKFYSQATRIKFSGKTAIGVEYYDTTTNSFGMANLRSTGEVIVTAGTIRTPHLLLSSGSGPALQLEQYSIPLVADVPCVGNIVKDHLSIYMTFSFKSNYSLPSASLNTWLSYFQNMNNIPTFFGAYPRAVIFNMYVSSKGDVSAPDLQILYKPDITGNTVEVGINLQNVKTKGWVRLQSGDPLVSPLVTLRDGIHPDDIEALASGIEIARSIMKTNPVVNLIDKELRPAIFSPAALRTWINQTAGGYTHYTGTCPIGDASSPDAVVDPFLRVKQITNVRVADGSILLHSGTGNPHYTILTTAFKAADIILGAKDNQFNASLV
jgi:choline dehydrogenase